MRCGLSPIAACLLLLGSLASAQTACPNQPKQRLMSAMVTHGIDPAIGMASLPVHGVDPVLSQGNEGAIYPLAPGGSYWLFCFYAKKRHHEPDSSITVALPASDTVCRRDVVRKLLCGPASAP